MAIDLTTAKLADIKKKAQADPATVLAMVEEIEFLRRTSMIKTELLGKSMLKTKESETKQ